MKKLLFLAAAGLGASFIKKKMDEQKHEKQLWSAATERPRTTSDDAWSSATDTPQG